MAISTYAELQTAVENWLDRTDLNARIPEFIALAEAEIRRRLRRKTVRTTLAIAAEETNLPAACAELRSIHLESGSPYADGPIPVVTLEVLAEQRARRGAVAGRPVMATPFASMLVVSPAPDQSYTARIAYYEKLVSLDGGANTTNSTLSESPDLYLYGALKHAAVYLQHDERIPVWASFFEAALEQLETQRQREETAASLTPVRLPRVFA